MVSVIMTTYNGRKFVEKALDSILNQSIDDSEMEIVIVDDASTDGTDKILLEYQKKFPCVIKLIISKLNSSITHESPRNIGVDNSNGEYIMFCDQDDWYSNNALEILHKKMDDNVELDYIEYAFEFVDELGNFIRRAYSLREGFEIYANKGDNVKMVEMVKEKILPGYTYVWNKIYRRSFLEKNCIRHNAGEQFTGYQDNYFSGLISMYCEKFGKLYDVFYYYRVWTGSDSNSGKKNDLRLLERVKVGNIFWEEITKREIYVINKHYAEFIFLRIYYEKTFFAVINNFSPVPYDMLEHMRMTILYRCPDYKSNPFVKARHNLAQMLDWLELEWNYKNIDYIKEMVK